MSTEFTITIKLVISAIVGGVTVLPLLKPGISKDEEQRIAWMLAAVAITTFLFFQAVITVIAIIAALIAAFRVGPILSKEAIRTTGEIRKQVREARNQNLEGSQQDRLEHLRGHVPDDVLEEQRQWLEQRGIDE